jgi:hypothetical protein
MQRFEDAKFQRENSLIKDEDLPKSASNHSNVEQ